MILLIDTGSPPDLDPASYWRADGPESFVAALRPRDVDPGPNHKALARAVQKCAAAWTGDLPDYQRERWAEWGASQSGARPTGRSPEAHPFAFFASVCLAHYYFDLWPPPIWASDPAFDFDSIAVVSLSAAAQELVVEATWLAGTPPDHTNLIVIFQIDPQRRHSTVSDRWTRKIGHEDQWPPGQLHFQWTCPLEWPVLAGHSYPFLLRSHLALGGVHNYPFDATAT